MFGHLRSTDHDDRPISPSRVIDRLLEHAPICGALSVVHAQNHEHKFDIWHGFVMTPLSSYTVV